ncbi:MAG: DUF3052 family protein [Rhodobacteraceae bacterium]|nr:DUF3052 family protein [Paracoccaceae bacterium]
MPSSANRGAGYSGTPLARKLGIRPAMAMVVLNAPWPYAATLGLEQAPGEIGTGDALPDGLDFVHVFTPYREELAARLKEARHRIAPDGMIWVSWPKKASKRYSEVTEDTLRELCLPLGLVDVKVCAVDEVWSGLKLVIRRELRPR